MIKCGDGMSALMRITEASRPSHEVRKVPTCDIERARRTKKSRPKAASKENSIIADHAASNAGFDLRRYAMKPIPAKPRIIMAHVDSSGTAAVNCATTESKAGAETMA